MTSDVSLQFAKLNAGIITLGALVRLLVSVSVSNMSHQLSRCCESRVAMFAQMRFSSCVSINVICEAGDCLESAFANVAFVRSGIEQELLLEMITKSGSY